MVLDAQSWFNAHGLDEHMPGKVNEAGDYALILASRQGRHDLVWLLLSEGVNPNCVDAYGNNALWAACYAESEVCCRLLVKNECRLDYQNPAGNTALSYAASSGKDKMVSLLLELGANPALQNQDGMAALDLASSRAILKLLRAVSAK